MTETTHGSKMIDDLWALIENLSDEGCFDPPNGADVSEWTIDADGNLIRPDLSAAMDAIDAANDLLEALRTVARRCDTAISDDDLCDPADFADIMASVSRECSWTIARAEGGAA